MLSKAVDPGCFDNLAAGGLEAGESPLDCAWRELAEEAGLAPEHIARLEALGTCVTERMEPQGWHSESLTLFNVHLYPGVVPVNRDGEVMQFDLIDWPEVLRDWQNGTWTHDAACVMARAGLHALGA
ncbi:MAG: NUDIX domain-containing protein [Alphaproteobacteria bacterium]|nr:NUDIX domain-containing protein [Alphaproteobacteria bacterium]